VEFAEHGKPHAGLLNITNRLKYQPPRIIARAIAAAAASFPNGIQPYGYLWVGMPRDP